MNLRALKEMFKYPTALAGVLIILIMTGISIYAVIAIPYNEAIRLWRGSEQDWYRNPKTAAPRWYNWFRKEKLPETFFISTEDDTVIETVDESGGQRVYHYTFPFDYSYDSFPDELTLYFTAQYAEKAPFVGVTWITPDGREIRMGNFAIEKKHTYRITQDEKLQRKLGGLSPVVGLFTGEESAGDPRPLKGEYRLQLEAVTFEAESALTAELVVYGKLAGWAGTDHLRRDLMVALLWGAPIALSFGLLAAVGTSLAQLIIAGTGAWFGGWVDELLQRITEVNMVIPFLPILIMIGTFYSRNIFTILSAVILLSIFGSGIKTFRAVFMQIKESAYIEAARSYGASSARIIFTYMIPRLIPMLIPQLVVLIPSFVFLEASLAVLGLGDPTLPTWGKMIDESRSNGALFQGWYYWVLEPSALLMVTGLAFTVVGYAMDRVFNPRLRE